VLLAGGGSVSQLQSRELQGRTAPLLDCVGAVLPSHPARAQRSAALNPALRRAHLWPLPVTQPPTLTHPYSPHTHSTTIPPTHTILTRSLMQAVGRRRTLRAASCWSTFAARPEWPRCWTCAGVSACVCACVRVCVCVRLFGEGSAAI
jgi:hypothetical protein